MSERSGAGDDANPLQHMLARAPVLRIEDVPALLRDLSIRLGVVEMVPYLIDYQQRVLSPLVDDRSAERSILGVDSTLAGRCYRDNTVYAAEAGQNRLWLPMLDDTERLGVLEAVLPDEPSEAQQRTLLAVATLLARIMATRAQTGDKVELVRRRLPMTLAAEMQWSLLPPLTFATSDLTVSGVLEPCYDIGGDSFDYAVNGDLLHVAVFDAMGHGLAAAQLAAMTMAAYRNARRSGLGLVDTYRSLDRWVSSQFPGRFVTAVVAELEVPTGELSMISAGHPSPLLFRRAQLVKALESPTALPLGLEDTDIHVQEEGLEPGDRLLVYTDGIVEARIDTGTEFGVDRLSDFMCRQLAAELPGPETMRRLLHLILDHQEGQLQDDASAVLLDWSPRGEDGEPPELPLPFTP